MGKRFAKGFTLAVLALSAIKQADAFVAKPSASQVKLVNKGQGLFALPKIVKKGEKVETEPDVGGIVQALGFLGASAAALGVAFAGPQNGDVPPINLPGVSVPSKSSNAATTEASAPSITKKSEKKLVKAKKTSSPSGGYDLELDEGRTAAKETKASFDRKAAAKEAEEARQAAKAKSKAAATEKQAATEARKQEAEARRNNLAEEKAKKEAARATRMAEAKANAAKERESAPEVQRAKVAKAAVTNVAKAETKGVKVDDTSTKAPVVEVVKQEEQKTPKAGEQKLAKETENKEMVDAEPHAVEAGRAPEKQVPAPKPAPVPPKSASSGAALGKVSGSASGGQILQKEEVSENVLTMLKKYK